MLIDLKQITGRCLNQVKTILGDPEKDEIVKPSSLSEDLKEGHKYYFQKDKIEIVFIDGIADWITLHYPGVPFEESGLEELGLETEVPTFKTHYIMRWNNLTPFTEITFFSKSNNIVDYILIKSFQK